MKALSFHGIVRSNCRYAHLTMHTVSGKSVCISLSNSDAQGEGRKELQVMHLLDKYGVSDAFYLALSMECADSLPRA